MWFTTSEIKIHSCSNLSAVAPAVWLHGLLVRGWEVTITGYVREGGRMQWWPPTAGCGQRHTLPLLGALCQDELGNISETLSAASGTVPFNSSSGGRVMMTLAVIIQVRVVITVVKFWTGVRETEVPVKALLRITCLIPLPRIQEGATKTPEKQIKNRVECSLLVI